MLGWWLLSALIFDEDFSKHNQKEEAFAYHNICLALSKRIKRHNELRQTDIDEKETTEAITPDFAEGLRRMLVSLYGHTSHNVLSSTMAAKLLHDGERFRFSHARINFSMTININWVSAHMLSCIATWWLLCLDGHPFRHWNDSCLTCRIHLWLREPSAQGFHLGGGVPSEPPVLAGRKIHIFHSEKKWFHWGYFHWGTAK